MPADVHLRAVPAGRRAAGLRRAGGVGRVERHRILQRGDRCAHRTLWRLHRYRLRGAGPGAGCRAASRRGTPRHGGAAHRLGRPGAPAFVRCTYPPLGIVLGRRAGSRVVAISGLPPHQPEDRLKAVAAAAASSGAVAMFHMVGSTPEAPTLRAALAGYEPEELYVIGLRELREARDALTSADAAVAGTPIGAVSLGTPHASLAELREIATLLTGSAPLTASSCWSRRPATSWRRQRQTGRRRASGVPALSCWSTPAATWGRCCDRRRCRR